MIARATPVGEALYCKLANVVHIAVSESWGLSLIANVFYATAERLQKVDWL